MKANYGIDAPNVIRNFFLLALSLFLIGYFFPVLTISGAVINLRSAAFSMGVTFFLCGALMIMYAKWGKYNHRDRMLKLVNWKGNEKVLDIGTGRGLLMIGAAKKLTSGKSVGIDIWNAEDLSNNSIDQLKKNIEAEGVVEKTELLTENIIKTGFQDQAFDVIVSNLCLHNIYDKPSRDKACAEIFRILKKDGVIVISDFKHTTEYSNSLTKLGMKTEKVGTYFFDTFPPLTVIRAVKQ